MAITLKAAGGHSGAATRRMTSDTRAAARRGRGRLMLEVLALIVIAALLVLAPVISRTQADTFDTSNVLIEPGDTLWEIAAENPVPGLSTSETVRIIAEINSLDGGDLPAGMAVQVPVEAGGMELALK